ncbi:hypothetical protein ISS86_00765 [Candidatus Microgenomates bacterium]|nr:hypothetical protein [Candidatus Microgenomates bacterium]
MPLLFFLAFLVFGAGAAGLVTPFSAPPEPVDTISVNPCYQLEGTRIALDPSYFINPASCEPVLDSRAYLRLRQQVGIIDAKIKEGEGAHSGNDCSDSYYGSLRKVGVLPAAAGPYDEDKDIYWENENYTHDDLSAFILINTEKKESKHYFDVYIDEAEKDALATDPKYEFIRNCKETGGLVPVIEGPMTPTFPPQAISLTDQDFNDESKQRFDVDGFVDNFDKYKEDNFKDKYFMRIDPPAGQEVEIPVPAEQVGLFYKTIDPETKTYNVFFHAGIIYLLEDQIGSKPYMYNPSDTKPPFSVRRDPTLQLAALKFITVSEWTWATPECKPALYLYPEKPTRLRVVLKPAGQLTVTDPVYDPKRGWEVVAYPDGTIRLEGEDYPYLFYEAEIEKVRTPQKGWVVKKEALEALFDETLPLLGLNQNELVEFKKYWLGALNQAPYYFVGLVDREEIERIEPIEFSEQPDTFIRVRLFFEPLEELVAVQSPDLPPTPIRQGFVAVDWGGILSSGTCQSGEALDVTSR